MIESFVHSDYQIPEITRKLTLAKGLISLEREAFLRFTTECRNCPLRRAVLGRTDP